MSTSKLSEPLQIGDLTVPNRIFMASLTRNRNFPGTVPNDIVELYYKQRAEGGAGLIFTEGTLISQQGTEWPYAPRIDTDEHVASWKKVVDGVHASGGFIFSQLWHVGRVAHPDMPEQKASGKPVYGPSAISARGGKFRQLPGTPGYVAPTEIENPREIIEEYRFAAKQAKKAGFDGVELHSANGYLPNQFLDCYANNRTDEWGGSVENRCRFALEATKALIDVWGPARVGIKINPGGGYNDVGMTLQDTTSTFTHLITELCKLNIAYIQISRYSLKMDVNISPPYLAEVKQVDEKHEGVMRGTPHDALAIFGPLIKVPPKDLENRSETQIRGEAATATGANPSPTRLLLNVDLTPEEAEKLLEEGKIDGAVFGMSWITNPDFYKRIVEGKGFNQNVNFHGLYSWNGDNIGEGYADYPIAVSA